MNILNAKFIDSVGRINQLDGKTLPEIAFVGRSNVGKSSLINYLVGMKSLARTSNTPGRTRLINYFCINDSIHFVDLPGYGFAKGEKREQAQWKALIEQYLAFSKNIKLLCMLVDIRRSISEEDKQMLRYMDFYGFPFIIIVTKCDKVAKSKRSIETNRIAKEVGIGTNNVYLCSTSLKIGKQEILDKFDQFVSNEGVE